MKRAAILFTGLMLLVNLASANGIFTFANFSETNAGGNDFQFINSSQTTGLFTTITAPNTPGAIPVNFNYEQVSGALPGSLQGTIAAMMTMTLNTTETADTTGTRAGYTTSQYFDEAGSIVFSLDTPLTSGFDCTVGSPCSNLLTVTVSSLDISGLSGTTGGGTANLNGTYGTSGGYLDTFTFSSDFLTFGSQNSNQLSLSFTSATPCFTQNSIGSCADVNTNLGNLLANFTAAGTGSFSASPEPVSSYVPEPVTMVLTGSSLIGLAVFLRRKRVRT